MASAKQIKARKLFAMRAKRGDFRKGKTGKPSHPPLTYTNVPEDKNKRRAFLLIKKLKDLGLTNNQIKKLVSADEWVKL
tara:strand:+ start:84 stop:320 length:237 start_codon:yes stop_codon:yes gene_type:complete